MHFDVHVFVFNARMCVRILYFTAGIISFFISTGLEKSSSDKRNGDFAGPILSPYIMAAVL